MDKTELMEIALHLYMVKNNIPVNITKHSPEQMYVNTYLQKAESMIDLIANLINKKDFTHNDIYHLVNCKYGGFNHAIKVLSQ